MWEPSKVGGALRAAIRVILVFLLAPCFSEGFTVQMWFYFNRFNGFLSLVIGTSSLIPHSGFLIRH